MACGITVAPSIEAARSTESAPCRRGTRPASMAAGSGGEKNSPAQKPTVSTASIEVTTPSNARWPRFCCTASTSRDTTPVMTPPSTSGTPNSRLSAMAPPITSARSVAAATTSACAQ